MKNQSMKRLLSLILCFTMIAGLFPIGIVNAAVGDTGSIAAVNVEAGSKVSDPGNLHGWKQYFKTNPLSTENAGGVWVDKSVFTSVSDFKNSMVTGESITGNTAYNQMTIDPNHFLVALSAIAATKEIVGYSAIPTDTVFVLDLSQSMDNGQYVPTMVTAANDAIKTLLDLNLHNRISVVLYSGNTVSGNSDLRHSIVLLPLDRYSAGTDGKFIAYTGSNTNTTVSVATGVKKSNGSGISGSKQTDGGTYIQGGLYAAYNQFKAAHEDGSTVIESDLIQGGTHRIPVIALMSDGLPTVATDQYSTFTRTAQITRPAQTLTGVSNYGDGTANNNTITFLSQLTAKWLKESASQWYGNDALFYTLWLKNQNDNSTNPTLAPASSGATLDTWWKSYLNANSGSNITFRVNNNSSFSIVRDGVVGRVPVVEPATEEYNAAWQAAQNYVNRAFTATNVNDFRSAFEDIVETIIAQSRYYPTMVQGQNHESSGYITIEDPIGASMEVKNLKGIDIGGHLFTGEALIKMMIENRFGDRDTYTENGYKLIHTIRDRIGVSEEVAIALAEDAWKYGQLGLDPVTGKYSNYIGWYADANNKYLGFWHAGHTDSEVPAGATQIMKSYGFYGEIDASISDSNIIGNDMMHVAVRVATQLDDGDQVVTFGIPAALIPLVLYEVEVNSDNLETATSASLDISGATHPLRLLMEIGLQEGINELTVASIVGNKDHYHTDSDGNFVFYTNRWGDINVQGGALTPPGFTNHTATVSHYNPSVMNERYYYYQDSAIYTDPDGTKYEGATKPTGSGYYHTSYVFKQTGNGSEAQMIKKFVPITPQAIEFAEKDAQGNTWHIPGGTARYDVAGYVFAKSENTTETLPYLVNTAIPGYVEGKYEFFEMHGNNGRLVLGQATGIELTKRIPVVVPGSSTEDFVLNVAFSAPSGQTLPETVKVSYDAKTYVEMAIDAVRVTLDANQKAWIYGLPGGTVYTVTEENHDDYKPEAATVTGTVTEGQITPVSFTNRAKEAGRVVITKKVNHPFGDRAVPTTLSFEFIAELKDKNGDLIANTVVATSAGTKTTSADGTLLFTLKDGESLSINGLEEGSTVTVKEQNLPAGFTVDRNSASATTENDVVKELVFTNTYSPASVPGTNVKIEGTKLLDGRQWQDFDSYRFRLQYWNGSAWQTLAGGASDTATKLDPTFCLSDVISSFEFDKEGSYRFWIVEEDGDLGGVSYDASVREFNVVVKDNWNGAYEITSVESPSNRVQISSSTLNGTTSYTVQTSFTNRYGAASTFLDLSGSKVLVGDNVSSYTGQNGFGFELYTATKTLSGELQQNDRIYTSYLNEDADFIFDHNYIGHLVFDQVGSYYFIAREAQTGGDPLMVFDNTYYEIEVVVTDNMLGSLVANATVTKVSGNTRTQAASNGLDFTNERKPDPISVSISGQKEYNLTQSAGMFDFDLYEATLSGSVYTPKGSALLSAANDASGNFVFEDGTNTEVLKFAEAMDYHFVVRERIPAGVDATNTLNGITYDPTVYGITVRVTQSSNGRGRNVLNYQILVNGTASGSVRFENSYNASAQEGVTISGEKTLNGSTVGTEDFSFELYHASVSGTTVTLQSRIESKHPVEGTFSFTPISYTSLSDVGTHYYVVKEVIPAGVDASNTFQGVTYDAREYLVTVNVSDHGDGTLKVEKSVTLNGTPAPIKFENTYRITTPSAITLGGEKTLDGKAPVDGKFSFALYKATLASDGSFQISGQPISTKSTVNGLFSFDEIVFDQLEDCADYYFVIKEVIPAGADSQNTFEGIVYDPTEYGVHVKVKDNADGTLSVTKQYQVKTENRDQVLFANKTAEVKTTPQTSDRTNLVLWYSLFFVSGAALFVIPLFEKKKKMM